MNQVYIDMSMSLDGFIAGPRVGVANPMGDGGDQLHDWMFAGKSGGESRAFEEERFAATGALIMGRTMSGVGAGPWGDNPTFHAPVFVVTHRAAEPIVSRAARHTRSSPKAPRLPFSLTGQAQHGRDDTLRSFRD